MKKFNITDLKALTKANKEPFVAHWNITQAYNLRCLHCCVPKHPVFVSLEDARKTIAFLKRIGVFLVTLSGGECTIHPAFAEIYKELVLNGFYVSVFTNGTRFTPEIKALFKEYRPRKVEVSVYGVDADDFSVTTQSKEGYEAFLDCLAFLQEEGIRTVVKAPITKRNIHVIQSFIDLAKQYGAEYKFGTFVFSRLDGSNDPLSERPDLGEAIDIEFSDAAHRQGFIDREKKYGLKPMPLDEKCSALSNALTLEADNSFSFCGIMTEPKFKFGFGPDDKTIDEAYAEVVAYRDEVRRMYEEGPCGSCNLSSMCPGCPAHLILENGTTEKCSEYFRNGTLRKLACIHCMGSCN